MGYPVTYYCPRCEALHELEREGYLADKSVTPYPLEGWEYANADDPFEDVDGAFEDVDGVRIVCGDERLILDEESGCGEPFYLSFVRFEDGVEIEPNPEQTIVEIADDVRPSGPRGPGGPRGPRR